MKRPIPFGKYHLLERINVGGMAEVYCAKAYGVEGFERILAVKRILPNIAEDKDFIEMFVDEAKIAVQFNHANIAQIFDLGKVEDSFFIALEYVHGKDLRAIFDRCRQLGEQMPVGQACFIVMKVCEGLDYAHNKRDAAGREMHLVHRDVSPQNILISYEGEIKLIDFGIAKAAGKASKTQAGILKGKFGYMSPEQVRGLPLDRRSDIFSVGVVLYEMLTGERLFLGESDFATLEKVRNVEILPPSTYNRKISDELEQIVMKALERDVEERYQNAIDLHDDLQAYMYSAGEFYSRKDLALWVKQTFSREIEEEQKKLESYQDIVWSPGPPPLPGQRSEVGPVPVAATIEDSAVSVNPAGPSGEDTRRQPMRSPDGTGWDEDEVETEIFDRPPEQLGGLRGAQGQPVAARSAGHADGQFAGAHTPVQSRKGFLRRHGVLALVVALVVAAGWGVYHYAIYLPKQPGQIVIQADPADAEIYMDGVKQSIKQMPHTIWGLKPGYYILGARKDGYDAWERTVEVRAQQRSSVIFRLEPQATASIALQTAPIGATVRLDGRLLDRQTPIKISQLLAGKHRIEIYKSADYLPWAEDVTLKAGESRELNVTLLPQQVVLNVISEPRGEVFLVRDGQSERLGQAPVKIRVSPKYAYQVIVRRSGYEDWQQQVTFNGDAPVELRAVLQRGVAASSRGGGRRDISSDVPATNSSGENTVSSIGVGTLRVNSNPWTEIWVDGKSSGLTTPQANMTLPVGPRRITLKNPGFGIDESVTVVIRPNQVSKLIKNFKTE